MRSSGYSPVDIYANIFSKVGVNYLLFSIQVLLDQVGQNV